MSDSSSTYISFESKFNAFVPDETRVSSSPKQELELVDHNTTGLIVKSISYVLDIGLSVFIIPLLYNIYSYLKRGQTLGQKWMGIRIYRYDHIGKIASISQLLTRFMIKLFFLMSWAFIGMNIIGVGLDPYLSQQSTYRIFHGFYMFCMIVWIHGYVITMITNKDCRGIHDLISGTIVAYDYTHYLKRIIIGMIGCIVLLYIIFGIGPDILHLIDTYSHGSWEESYWLFRNHIDTIVLRGLRSMP